jgi:methyltransferase OMS1, mitochondrial
MGLNLIRWWHIRKATGRVLEVGCGTGRNFSYYGPNATSIIAIDSVPEMLVQAKSKLSNNNISKRVELKEMNAHNLLYDNESFDTVIDTFGLCSYDNPINVLNEMKRVCKKDGKILLLEHGKGSYNWINNVINSGAERHAHNWGCIWNRDILELVEKAGLRIVSSHRWHFGTTYIIEAKP